MFAALNDVLSRECALDTRTSAEYSYDEENLQLSVLLTANVILRQASEEDGQEVSPLVALEAVFALDYQLPSSPPVERRPELFGAFATLNGTYNAWPYVRELVQSLTTRMGLPGLIIPLYRMPVAGDETEEQASPKLRVVAGGTG